MTDDITFDDEEKLSFLFQPDALFSHQYLATFRRKQLEPEKRLMLAVLQDAVACFQEFIFAESRKKRMLFNEAENWIRDENSDHVFSFENICTALKLDSKYVREGLLRWKERQLAKCQNVKPIGTLSARHETRSQRNEQKSKTRVSREQDRPVGLERRRYACSGCR